MTKDVVKKGYEAAEKELEDKQIAQVKDIVKSTLSKIKSIDEDVDNLKNQIKELEEKKKILRLDIDDLKEGRLDRIEERQKTDEKTKKISVIIVEKEVHHHHHTDWWYQPFKITYAPHYPQVMPLTTTPFCGSVLTANTQYMNFCNAGGQIDSSATFTINSSVVKNNVIGTYAVGDKTIHLR